MANDMRLDLDFVDHPKVRRLIRQGGFEAFYGLIRLFSFAGKMYTDGIFKGCEKEDLDAFAEWDNQDHFADLLIGVGFLKERGGIYEIHDWKEHQPWLYGSKERSRQAQKAARARWNHHVETTEGEEEKEINEVLDRKNAEKQSSELAGGMQTASQGQCGAHAGSNAPSPSPSPSPSPLENAHKKKAVRFVPPTHEQVRDYCTERKNEVDPESFIAHYEANGWMRGKVKMKDWQAAVRYWERNEINKGGRYAKRGPAKDPWDDPDYYKNGRL